jgi:ABC-type polysaccharide/polyol phosphate transport system ATPase subunit
MAKITFENVTLQYLIYNAKSMSLRNQLIRFGTGGRLSHETKDIVTVTALKDVNFTLQDSDSVGLIGHNGAGKTTLLRTIAGIYTPSAGKVIVDGRISTIIELGAGMDPELTGFENIVRMGLMLGYSRDQMENVTPKVELFTDLGDFLSAPVRTYSAGMTTRLMFAVATCINPEILLIDEMFATGDSEFQEKAKRRMIELIESAKIFVFASHSEALIKQYCKRIFVLSHGTLTERNDL